MPIYTEEMARDYRGHLYHQNLAEEKCILDLAKERGGPALELACGAGRMMIKLARAGYTVYGLDASEHMLAMGRREAGKLTTEVQQRIHFVCGDMTNFAFARKFPLIIIPYLSFWFNLQPEGPRRGAERCIALMAEHLEPGGQFFIDGPYSCSSQIYMYPEWGVMWWDQVAERYGLRLQYLKYEHRQCGDYAFPPVDYAFLSAREQYGDVTGREDGGSFRDTTTIVGRANALVGTKL